VTVNGFLFTAGQVALDPDTGELVPGGITEQTTRALENLRAVLAAAGTDFSQVVKTTVFLVDMTDFTDMNAVYARAFADHRPARSTVAVAGLPRGARVEIEVIAAVKSEK
jgi:2-iminobutanoate/2-iminopropanoate deaminase